MFVCKKKTWEIQKVYRNRKTLPIVLGNDWGGAGAAVSLRLFCTLQILLCSLRTRVYFPAITNTS